MAAHCKVFIAGHNYNDHVIYPVGDRRDQKVKVGDIPGGARLLADILIQLCPEKSVNFINHNRPNTLVKTAMELDYMDLKGDDKAKTYRIMGQRQLMDTEAVSSQDQVVQISIGDLLILVDHHPCMPCQVDPWYRIYKSKSVQKDCNQAKWDSLLPNLYVGNAGSEWDKLAVVFDGEYLRRKGADITYHLSWSQAAEDIVRNFLYGKDAVADLQTFQQAIVRVNCDGVIQAQFNEGNPLPASLYCMKSEQSEGDFICNTPGRTPAIAAGFMAGMIYNQARGLKDDQAIGAGLLLSQKMASHGITEGGGSTLEYVKAKTEDLDEKGIKKLSISNLEIPHAEIQKDAKYKWNLLLAALKHQNKSESREGVLLTDLAKDIVTNGCEGALKHIPTVRFGGLITADRQEKESFRAIANLVEEYLRSPQTKPLSIGVFGTPGSGKSFGIKQVVKTVAGRQKNGAKKNVGELVFNLSQFQQYSDLVVAFRAIRDRALSGDIPMVLFDEFDTAFEGKELGWLRYFLAPMQDGEFQDSGHVRPLGPAIYIFIGGTCSTFEAFTQDLTSVPARDRKKPDFVSRLRGFVDIRGPDEVDANNFMHRVSRAILLRSMLERRLGYNKNKTITVDPEVLNALLAVPKFHHGARSLESILAMSRLHGQDLFQPSALPSAHQLNLHVDYDLFARVLGPEKRLDIASDDIAKHFITQANERQRKIIADEFLKKIHSAGCCLIWEPELQGIKTRIKDTEDFLSKEALANIEKCGYGVCKVV